MVMISVIFDESKTILKKYTHVGIWLIFDLLAHKDWPVLRLFNKFTVYMFSQ